MTKKKLVALDYAWRCLLACVEREGRPVSAGELAKEMGVSRNTAFARLMDMLAEETITYHQEWRGRVSVYRYSIGGHGA